MSDPIRDALREAGEAARRSLYPGMCRDGACMLAPCACADDAAAAAVAAFLRVIARQHVEELMPNLDMGQLQQALIEERPLNRRFGSLGYDGE